MNKKEMRKYKKGVIRSEEFEKALNEEKMEKDLKSLRDDIANWVKRNGNNVSFFGVFRSLSKVFLCILRTKSVSNSLSTS